MVMKLLDVFFKMVYCEIECVFLDELEGCVILILLIFYLLGIFLLILGEIFNKIIVDYLKFVCDFNEKFLGFEIDVYGLVKCEVNGCCDYFVDCVK